MTGESWWTPSQIHVLPRSDRTVSEIAPRRSEQARAWYPDSMLHNGAGDAFRHCWWSALMTRNLNVYVAAIVGDYHEHDAVGQPAAEKDMDLFNNARGRDEAFMTANDRHAANYCVNASLNETLRGLVV